MFLFYKFVMAYYHLEMHGTIISINFGKLFQSVCPYSEGQLNTSPYQLSIVFVLPLAVNVIFIGFELS